MLARQYDNYAWEQEEVTPIRRKQNRKKDYRKFRAQVLCVVGIGLVCSFLTVAISALSVQQANALIALKQHEEDLITKNEALKIDVDRLKSPARITGIAMSKLGMTTARSNIYVQADSKKIAYDGYAYAKK